MTLVDGQGPDGGVVALLPVRIAVSVLVVYFEDPGDEAALGPSSSAPSACTRTVVVAT